MGGSKTSGWQIMHKERAEQTGAVFGGGSEAWERRTLVPLVSEFRKTV